jgi:hypothetical protein
MFVHLQGIAEDVLARCDGNLLATAIMGRALSCRQQCSAWQHVLSTFNKALDEAAQRRVPQDYHNRDTVMGAIAAAKGTLKPAALKAFQMLQLLQVQRQLPLPLLQLLWSELYGSDPDLANEDVTAPLSELLDASLLCKVSVAVAKLHSIQPAQVSLLACLN